MHNWSDEELDRLSREAAQRYDPPSPDGGWEALSRRLDVEMPEKDRKRRAFFWLFFAGLLLGGTLYWSNAHHPDTAAENRIAQATPQNTPSELPTQPSSSSAGTVPEERQTLTVADPSNKTIPSPARTNESLSASTHSAPADRSSNTSFLNGPSSRVVHGPAAGVPKGTGTDRKSKVKQYQGKVPPAEAGNGDEPPVPARSAGESRVQSPVSGAQMPVDSGQDTKGNDQPLLTPAASPNLTAPEKTSAPAKVTGSKADDPQPTPDAGKPKSDNRNVSRRPGRWEFSLSIAPDLSAVEFYPLAKPGIMGGGTIGYHLSERWTVSTGLFYTVKYYDSPGEAYHLPGYWANNPAIKMKQVNAVCNMWDIPVNIRYDALVRKNTRIFASTGLSSYLMRKEDLHYYYTYNNNPYDKSYVYKKNKDYWFAIANVSVGLEQNLGKGFSLQAEPFAKFSLADVGTGRIRLNSYGLLVGLKYRPFKVVHPHH